jgi:hypothetical protein
VRQKRNYVRFGAAVLAAIAFSPLVSPALAQPDMEPPITRDPGMEMADEEEEVPDVEPQEQTRPVARAARIETGEAPVIDGDLSDLSWAKAVVIDDIRQRQPDPGAPATERTVIRVMYDASNLYFSIYAYDSNPDQILVRSRARRTDPDRRQHPDRSRSRPDSQKFLRLHDGALGRTLGCPAPQQS